MMDRLAEFISSRIVELPFSGCHIWMRQLDRRGYALANIKIGGRFKTVRVSRLVCAGLQSDEMACHTCDTPSCVNPDHLFRGYHADNMRDRSIKGRTARHAAKITPDDVREIRKRFSYKSARSGESARKLAAEYGISNVSIYKIITGKSWGSVA